jgi:DNA-binding beta-propeller fold protein YncE
LGVAVEPRGAHVYVAGFRDNAVAVFKRDAATGGLTFVEVQRNGVGGVKGLRGAHAVTVSGDGTRVYVAGRNDSAVVEFERDQSTGALTFRTAVKQGAGAATGLTLAASVALSPDDAHLYAVGELGNAVAVFGTSAAPPCAGDCDGTGRVTSDELLTLVNILLGTAEASVCPRGIPTGAKVNVALIIQAVNTALNGCGE